MPLKKVLEVDVNDTKFKEYLAYFEKYQAAIAKLPAAWNKIGAATGEAGASFGDMSAALMAQAELLHRINREHRELGRTASGAGRTMHGMAKDARDIARHVTDATRMLMKWTGIAGLVGAGGLFGLDRLAGNASSLRTRSMGLGVRPSTVLAARTNFGQLINAEGALGNLVNLQQSLGGSVAFNTLGIPGAWNASAGSALTSAMDSVHKLYRSTPRGELQNMPWWQQATKIFSPEDIRVIGNMSDAELRQHEKGYRTDVATNFGLKPGTLSAAQDVDRQLTRVGYTLEYTFLAALQPVMPQLTQLSGTLGSTVAAFLQGPGFANVVGLVNDGLHDLNKWISGKDFQSDVSRFTNDVGKLATAIGDAVDFITGLLPKKSTVDKVWNATDPAQLGKKLAATPIGGAIQQWVLWEMGLGPRPASVPSSGSGGGRGGGSGGSGKGGAPGAGDPRGMASVITTDAAKYGIDPAIALRVARSEGLGKFSGDNGTSFGAFQLHIGGGLGDQFRRQTGLDPSDPKNEAATIDWALKNVARTGWSPYYGAARVGVGDRQGIGTYTALPPIPASAPATGPVPDGPHHGRFPPWVPYNSKGMPYNPDLDHLSPAVRRNIEQSMQAIKHTRWADPPADHMHRVLGPGGIDGPRYSLDDKDYAAWGKAYDAGTSDAWWKSYRARTHGGRSDWAKIFADSRAMAVHSFRHPDATGSAKSPTGTPKSGAPHVKVSIDLHNETGGSPVISQSMMGVY